MLPVSLSETDTFTETVPLLVDSGAEDVLLDFEVAELMNIDLRGAKEERIYGFGNMEELGYAKQISILVEGFKHPIIADVIFVKNLGITGILGQRDLFEHYRITFDKPHRSFSLEDMPYLL